MSLGAGDGLSESLEMRQFVGTWSVGWSILELDPPKSKTCVPAPPPISCLVPKLVNDCETWNSWS